MRFVSLFSGIEAASVAWEPLCWEPVAFSEIDLFCCKLLAERFPDVPNLGDITKIEWEKVNIGTVDLVVGGSPCQSFSIAGPRTGLRGQSGLMFEYIRAVQEIRPRWFVWENVPGALSSEGGEAFEQLLREMDALGYGLAWRVLDAQFFGVAQRRERLFLVGHIGDMCAAEVLFEPESLQGDIMSSKTKRAELAADLGRSPYGVHGGPCVTPFSKTHRSMSSEDATVYEHTELANTLNTFDTGECRANEIICMNDTNGGAVPWIVRRLTPTECERLQGFPDGWTAIDGASDSARYKALGNSMAVPVMRWIGDRIEYEQSRKVVEK